MKNNNLLSYCKLVCEATIYGWQIIILNSIAHDEEQPGKNRSRGVIDIDTMIKIKNKIYTEQEVEILNMDLLSYYIADDMDEEELKMSKNLPKDASRKEYNKLLGKINKITENYKF